MNPLIIYLQPRDGLGKIRQELKNIPCDKIILKYFSYPEVYQIANKTILQHPEYDFIIWLQNDIVFTRLDYEKLTRGIQALKLNILGCSMNVDLSPKGLFQCAFTISPFDITPGMAVPFVDKGEYSGLIRVFHNGSVFIAKREFYLTFPLTGIGKAGYNADIKQGRELHRAGVSYFVDTRINLSHLRYEGVNQVGIKAPEIEFERN